MRKSHSFRLDVAISAWRHSLQHERFMRPEDLDELEQHVRDQVHHLVAKGHSEEHAFQSAMEAMGSQGETKAAYRNVYWGKLKQEKKLKDELIWRVSMLKNYVKIALRALLKQKGYASINILGLAIGLACFILISLFIRFELSYDHFHEKADRIYRIANEFPGTYFLGSNQFAVTPAPLAGVLMEEFPEVEHATQIAKVNSLMEYGNKKFYEDGIFATRHFFDVFSFKLLQGDPLTVLDTPNSIVLTKSLAKKYFGDEDPMGQTLDVSHSDGHFNGKDAMRIAGIVEDVPANSHFTFDYLVPVSSSPELSMNLDRWDSNSYLTYVSLSPSHSLPEFATKLPIVAKKHLSEVASFRDRPDEMNVYFPQALTDIHLRSHINFEFGVNGHIKYIYLFLGVALLILLIACINYVNLATARSVKRAMEVGVRKVMGAHRSQLIGQFMSEAIIPAFFALLIAVLTVLLLLPTFNALTARQITLDLLHSGGFLAMLLLFGLGVGILAGSYPALMMSSFHPINMMKGVLGQRATKTRLRNVLVVAQFTIAIALIIGTIVIQRQLHFIQHSNTGIDRDQVVSIEVKDQFLYERYDALKQTLLSHVNVLGVSGATSDPTQIDASSPATEWEGSEVGQEIMVYRSGIRHGYIDLFDIELVEGRDFSESMGTDGSQGLLINETLKRQLGWDTAVGKWFDFRGREFDVIGVVRDFNFLSLHQEMPPLALFIGMGGISYRRIFVKVRPDNMQETIAFLSETMAEFSPLYPFEYHFLDDAYNQMYQTESRLGALLSYFTFVALFIACLGLLGLATFMAQQRRKELGVRKVLGASSSDILVLLSKDFTRLVLIAFVLAAPIGYILLDRWLQTFAYRISVGLGTLLLAGAAVLVIAWLAVSFQAVRAAIANPVNSIRYE